jgi:plasmid stabilization system protein ParE
MTRLVVAPRARNDLDSILGFLRHEAGEVAALRYGHRFSSALQLLVEFPLMGVARPAFGPTMRLWPVDPYLMFYRFDGSNDLVSLIRILDGRREISARLFLRH